MTLTRETETYKATFYVTAEGEPCMLRIMDEGSDDPMTIDFADHGKPVEAQAPPEAQIAAAAQAE